MGLTFSNQGAGSARQRQRRLATQRGALGSDVFSCLSLHTLETVCLGIGLVGEYSTSPSEVSGELLTALEKLNEQLFVPVRTHSCIRSPRLAASGL